MRWSRAVTVPTPVAAGASLLRAVHVDVDLGARPVLRGVDLEVRAGELLALVGPNGAGKTTLLSALAGDLPYRGGSIELEGRPLSSWSAGDLARRRAVLPQQVAVAFPFTVTDIVRMGRAPWAGTPAGADDDDAVAAALEEADVVHLADRPFPRLSGGERARVALARVLAQRAQIVLLDEPTASLDVHHTEQVCDIARSRARDGAGVVVVLHDLGLAAAHADRIAVVANGRIVADGAPSSVCRPDLLSRVYGHDIEVLTHPTTGMPIVVPRRQRHTSLFSFKE